MTTASSRAKTRRGRYRPAPAPAAFSLTPKRRDLLAYVAEFGLLSTPQLVRLSGFSVKAVQRLMRALFDAGLVAAVPVARTALAFPGEPVDPTLAFGTAPNVYVLTALGAHFLDVSGWEGEPMLRRLNMRSSLVGHELFVQDVHIHFHITARSYFGHRLERWQEGKAAEIDLRRAAKPTVVRPDSWFIYSLGEKVLCGLVEADRATETSLGLRWKEKLLAYEALFVGDRLQQALGYRNARIVVVAPTERRRDRLAEYVANSSTVLAPRVWLADRSVLEAPDLAAPRWRVAGHEDLRPLVPPELAVPAGPGPAPGN